MSTITFVLKPSSGKKKIYIYIYIYINNLNIKRKCPGRHDPARHDLSQSSPG
ncbi:hypothetical protein K7X86_00575 [Candidatus Sulcia muelleri]|nr:hypothetical protein [Candidatus Karelsulcia muelleri]